MRSTPLTLLLWCAAWPAAAQVDMLEHNRHAQAEQHYESGLTAVKNEDYATAVREFKRAIELDPQLVLAYYELGRTHMALRDYPQATQTYIACREVFERRASLTQQEQARIERDRTDQMQNLREIIRELRRRSGRSAAGEPASIMQLEERLRVLESAGLKGAEQSLQVPAWLTLALGSAYLRQGLLPDAERAYKEALAVDSKMGAAHNNLAFVFMHTGRFKEAHEEVRQAGRAEEARGSRGGEDALTPARASPGSGARRLSARPWRREPGTGRAPRASCPPPRRGPSTPPRSRPASPTRG